MNNNVNKTIVLKLSLLLYIFFPIIIFLLNIIRVIFSLWFHRSIARSAAKTTRNFMVSRLLAPTSPPAQCTCTILFMSMYKQLEFHSYILIISIDDEIDSPV